MKPTELLQEANRLRGVASEMLEEARSLEAQYSQIKEQERRAALSNEERDLEDKARTSVGECGCICGCRSKVSGYVYAGRIHFGRCDDCNICS